MTELIDLDCFADAVRDDAERMLDLDHGKRRKTVMVMNWDIGPNGRPVCRWQAAHLPPVDLSAS
jgi:hypothetical protein